MTTKEKAQILADSFDILQQTFLFVAETFLILKTTTEQIVEAYADWEDATP